MSGILGINYLNQQPIEREKLARMLDILKHRGGDGVNIWQEGSIGLGHQMLWTTPESLREKLPAAKGKLAITADARLDNREELIPALGLTDYPTEEIKRGSWARKALIAGAVLVFGFTIWESQDLVRSAASITYKAAYYRKTEVDGWQKTNNPNVPQVGELAPDFELTDVHGQDIVRLSDFRGNRPVVLLFGSFT